MSSARHADASRVTDRGVTRRRFVGLTTAGLGAAGLVAPAAVPLAPRLAVAAPDASDALAGRLWKTLKIGMIKAPGASLAERFAIAKAAGFDGVEMNFPGDDVVETKRAIAESGLPVDGSVCAGHWQIRHTSPDAATRARALDNLLQALRDTRAVGGHSVLLVVGKGEDGPEDELWSRSVDNIARALTRRPRSSCATSTTSARLGWGCSSTSAITGSMARWATGSGRLATACESST
jgi:L-ribulose-5-phosphate 3-epimerase